jgi:hypothetical protein
MAATTALRLATLLLCTAPAFAQNQATVQIAFDRTVNIMTAEAIGAYTDLYDGGGTINPKVAAYLHTAGMYTIAFPGGYGSYADLYHWNTASGTKYENFAKQDHFFPSESNMAHMVPAIEKIGTAVIAINYGSNDNGTGPGEPASAAAWVAYLNGSPDNPKPIGKDSTGKDWKTVGYWASLRAQAPLASDDGLNHLRANHPKPLAIKLWQIGSEVYNNGFYGGDHKSEQDLHAPYPATEAENEKRRKNPSLAPAFYGQRVAEFSRAMKDVDPTVWVGATLTLTPIDNFAPDWNPEVLKASCPAIDFAAFTWRSDHRNHVDPYNIREDGDTLAAPAAEIGAFLKEALYDFKKFCPAGHQPRVAITQMSPVHWPVVTNKLTDGLFAADALALLIETGTINTDWNELHDGYLFTSDSNPGPAFYGIQMLHIAAHDPGDQFVQTTSSSPLVAAHAVHRLRDGSLGLLLVNKDPNTPAEVKVTLTGAALAATGTRFDYGPTQFKSATGPTRSPFPASGTTFTVTIPPYTITDIVLPKQ